MNFPSNRTILIAAAIVGACWVFGGGIMLATDPLSDLFDFGFGLVLMPLLGVCGLIWWQVFKMVTGDSQD